MQAVDFPVWLERKGRGVVGVEREEGTGNIHAASSPPTVGPLLFLPHRTEHAFCVRCCRCCFGAIVSEGEGQRE